MIAHKNVDQYYTNDHRHLENYLNTVVELLLLVMLQNVT